MLRRLFFAADFNKIGQEMMLQGSQVQGAPVGQAFLSVFDLRLFVFGCVFEDSLTDVNKGSIFYFIGIFLQFVLDIFNQQLIPDIP